MVPHGAVKLSPPISTKIDLYHLLFINKNADCSDFTDHHSFERSLESPS